MANESFAPVRPVRFVTPVLDATAAAKVEYAEIQPSLGEIFPPFVGALPALGFATAELCWMENRKF